MEKQKCTTCIVKKTSDFNEEGCRDCDNYVVPEHCMYCGYIFNPKQYIENGYKCYMCTEGV